LDNLVPDEPIRVWLNIVNIGQNDATIDFIAADVWIRRGRTWEEPGIMRISRKPENFRVLKSGQAEFACVTSRQPIGKDDIDRVYYPEVDLTVIGEIGYSDANGMQRRMSFHRTYVEKTDRFVVTPDVDPDDEYSD
jgi:hypothetical protein